MTISPADPPLHQTLRCRTVASGGLKHLNYVRGLPPLVIEERFGPRDDVPLATPPETLLAALGSCLGARIHANAASASIEIRSLELDIEVDVTSSPMWELPVPEPRRVGFEAIRVAVRIEADAPQVALDALVAHAVLWSPIANTLHDPTHLDVAVSRTDGEGDGGAASDGPENAGAR